MAYKLIAVDGIEFYESYDSLKDAIKRCTEFSPGAVIFLKDGNGTALNTETGEPLGTRKKGRVCDSRMTPAFQELLGQGYVPTI